MNDHSRSRLVSFHHSLRTLLFTVLLLGCGSVFSIAKGSPSTESDFDFLEAANRQYLQLPAKDSPKPLVEQLATIEWQLDRNEREQNFITCAEASDTHGIASEDYKLNYTTSLLTEIEMYKYYFRKFNIPETVWGDHISRLRETALAIYTGKVPPWIQKSIERNGGSLDPVDEETRAGMLLLYGKRELKGELIEALEDHARKSNSPFSYVYTRGGCGSGGGTLLTLKIIPATGTAYILQEYRAITCELKKIDVYDRNKCKGWVLVQNRPMTNLAGRFRVYALWADGQSLKEAIRIDASQQNSWDIRPVQPKR